MSNYKPLSLSRDTLFYSLANWGRRIVTFVIAPVMIAYFTPKEFGYFSLVITIASFCSILGLLAVADQGLPRFFIDTQDETDKKSYVSTSFFISGAGVLFIILLVISITPVIPRLIKDIKAPIAFTSLIALTCFGQSIQYAGSNMLKWTFQSPLFMKLTFLQAVAGGSLSIFGIIFWDWRVTEVLIVGALVALGAGGWAIISIKEFVKFSEVSKGKAIELTKYSWPMLGVNIFAFFTRSLDRIFLASLGSLGAVGIYSVSAAFASVFETLVSGFFFAWGPYMLSTFRETWAPQRYAGFFSTLSCFGILSIIGLGLWGPPIVTLLKPEGSYREIGIYIPWITSGMLLYFLGSYFAPGPSITKKTYWKLIAFILAAASNAALNYLLIPRFGILGAGMATTISSLIAGIFNQIVSNRLYYVPNRWKFSFAYILMFTIIVSLLQQESISFNIYSGAISIRLLLTFFLVVFAVIPYYSDIQKTDLLSIFTRRFILQKT